jgi:hypothetical protein
MNTLAITESPSPAYSHAFGCTLLLDELRVRAPAVFAAGASDRTKPTYRFINTHAVLEALLEAGFQLADARQTRPRQGSDPTYARHMIRLRPMREILKLEDCIPEICLVNAHDGTSAYQLVAGLYRPTHALAGSVQSEQCLLFGVFDRYKSHVRSADCFADRLGIRSIVFISLHVRLDKLRRDELYRVPKLQEFTRPEMGARAGLHPDETRRQLGEKGNDLRSLQLFSQCDLASCINPCT